MNSTFQVVNDIIELSYAHGMRKVVISPGSRNAPLTIAFDQDERFETFNIPDERSAGFVALGMAQALREPVAVVCTSGSAVLNYGPAIAEAFYQEIPIVVMSADRPEEWIDQMDGQTIRQQGALQPHLRFEAQLRNDHNDEDVKWHNNRLIQEAFIHATGRTHGPVHLNIPFREPLYGRTAHTNEKPRVIRSLHGESKLGEAGMEQLQSEWNRCEKRMILVGSLAPNGHLQSTLEHIAQSGSAVVLSETTSNLKGSHVIDQIDLCLEGIYKHFDPELLIVVGGPVVSKKIKSYLRGIDIRSSWAFTKDDQVIDTYQSLTHKIEADAADTLDRLHTDAPSLLVKDWYEHWESNKEKSQKFLSKIEWCDLQLFERLSQRVKELHLHLANSTPIRYSQLFDWDRSVKFYCNRGTSGIDGSTSTALGHALTTDDTVLMVTGDISFFYDSNAFFNNHLPKNLRILLINNAGGNIFKFIPGPSTTGRTEDHFTSKHNKKAQGIASAHGLDYREAGSLLDFERGLEWLLNKDHENAVILEAQTPSDSSPAMLRAFFKHLH